MSVLKIGFGLVLSYPVYTFLIPTFIESAKSRHWGWLQYSNPTLAEITGVNFIPNMLLVVVCVGLGLIASEMIFAGSNILAVYSKACVKAIRILTSRKRSEVKS